MVKPTGRKQSDPSGDGPSLVKTLKRLWSRIGHETPAHAAVTSSLGVVPLLECLLAPQAHLEERQVHGAIPEGIDGLALFGIDDVVRALGNRRPERASRVGKLVAELVDFRSQVVERPLRIVLKPLPQDGVDTAGGFVLRSWTCVVVPFHSVSLLSGPTASAA